ncbi:hypothetical protein NIES267_64620 [Calothrix parasitica NIES-267]|uniref:Uncharacterized protein n=1 Tax=Calothrix parasitica NIES-267 TaxID=1973488 RepID=A0A1Z4M0L1_9CYAN|nr:hypothetical protein NIES267_64620 [Calothrix parasitica NIES-267]
MLPTKTLASNKISGFGFCLSGATPITLGFLRNISSEAGYFIFWVSLTTNFNRICGFKFLLAGCLLIEFQWQ